MRTLLTLVLLSLLPSAGALAEKATPGNSAAAWSARQATGAPNVPKAGDHANAWATLAQDNGVEWIELTYEKAVRVTSVRIFENLAPGAVTRITARVGDHHIDLWAPELGRPSSQSPCPKAPSGATYTARAGMCVLEIEVGRAYTTDTIRVWLDTRRVTGWNEIDAVELVGTDSGKVLRQWAKTAWASSSYASGTQPLSELVGHRVRVRLLNRDEIRGTMRAVVGGFLELEERGRLKWAPLSAVATVERQ
jgi:hypothetical protein